MSRTTPLYQLVRDRLLQRITSGELAVGDRLEPEIELAEAYQVSRATMRNAIRDLVQDGLLTRRPGVGTMVIRSTPEIRSTRLELLLETLAERTEGAQLLVLDSSVAAAPADVAEALGVKQREKVLRVFRICKVKGEAVALCRTWLPLSLGITAAEAGVAPLYNLVERTYQTPLSYGHDSVGAIAAAGDSAKLLGARSGTPLVSVNRIGYSGANKPVLFSQALFRADSYRYEVALPRDITSA